MIDPARPYGEGRIRSNVSYADVERAAIAILKSERRPTVETIREALGSGSPDTIGTALRRFWRDLGARIEGDPAALTRMPGEIAELADGMWQRALKLAGDAANHDDNAARERLRQRELETDIKQRSFELREREIDTQARERERALADAREHLLSLSKALSREQATNQVHERRIADFEAEVAQYREQIAALMAGAIVQRRSRQPRRTAKRTEKANPRENTARVKRAAPAKGKATPKKSTRFNRTSRRRSRHPPRKTLNRIRR